MDELVATVVHQEKAKIGAIVPGYDHETKLAVCGRIVEIKTIDGRVEVLVRYGDGVVAWLPTYRTH